MIIKNKNLTHLPAGPCELYSLIWLGDGKIKVTNHVLLIIKLVVTEFELFQLKFCGEIVVWRRMDNDHCL